MTKKEIYNLALNVSQTTCRAVFESDAFHDSYFKNTPKGKLIVKKVYDKLEPLLLDKELSCT